MTQQTEPGVSNVRVIDGHVDARLAAVVILPGNISETRSMAKDLRDALELLGMTSDCRDAAAGPLTENATRNLMAMAFGFVKGWEGLEAAIKEPHEPTYLDSLSDDDQSLLQGRMGLTIAVGLGYDYAHGSILNALQMSGSGYSPKYRRMLAEDSTPWGVAYEREELAPGIVEVRTGSHGGILLSAERQAQMPVHLGLPSAAYEEDCEWARVAVAFPEFFKDEIAGALGTLNVYTSASVPRVRNLEPKHEKILSEVMLGYVPPDKDPMNRPKTEAEVAVIAYLAECVRLNRRPVAVAEGDFPSLQDWVDCLAKAPRVDGCWPKLAGPWPRSLSWGSMDDPVDDWLDE